MDYQKESERHFKERKSQQNEHGPIILLILDPGLSEGVLCNHPSLSVGPSVDPSVFKYLGDSLMFCMKSGYHKGSKVTEPDF